MSDVASGAGLQRLPREVDAGAKVTTLVELFRRAVSRERDLLNYKKDGHWRRVIVRTPARLNLDIRHKLGYFAPKS